MPVSRRNTVHKGLADLAQAPGGFLQKPPVRGDRIGHAAGHGGQESGVGRWHTVRLATLSFYEYIQIKQIAGPALPNPGSLAQLFEWPNRRFMEVAADARPLVGHFHEYLLRGGFPQSALIESISQAQKLLREDIVLQPQTVVTEYVHQLAYCPSCRRNVFETAQGELRNCSIGPVTKAVAVYLRHEVKLSYRDVQKVFTGLFGMPFVPASAMAFTHRTAMQGSHLYEDLRDNRLLSSATRSASSSHVVVASISEEGINPFPSLQQRPTSQDFSEPFMPYADIL